MNINLLIGLTMAGLVIAYLKTEREYNINHKDRVTDYLPWHYGLADGTILNKNGSVTRVLKFKNRDLESITDEGLVVARERLNNILKRLGEGYTLHVEARRERVKEYPKSDFQEKIYQMMDNTRREKNMKGDFFETTYYISITYFFPNPKESFIKKVFLDEKEEKQVYERVMEKFNDEYDMVYRMLKEELLKVEKLDLDETVTYLHSCISNKNHKIKAQEGMYLDSYISDTEIIPGLKVKVGDQNLGVISLLSFPETTFCGMLDSLNKLGIEYRWVSRYIYLDNDSAVKLAEKYEAKMTGNARELHKMASDGMWKSKNTSDNQEKKIRAAEAVEFKTDILTEEVKAGYYTFTIILKNKNMDILTEDLKKIESILNMKGFVATVETVNSLEALFGTMPGDIEHNVRKPIVTTANLIDLLPLSTDWDGDKINKFLKREALIFCESGENTSFKVNLHKGDVGHTMVLGTTGSGKSVLLGMLGYQARKYGAQVIFFDKGASSRVLCEAGGGKFYDIGVNDIEFQPLRDIDDRNELEWAYEWICGVLEHEGLDLKTDHKNAVYKGLQTLSTTDKNYRTITSLAFQTSNQEVRDILRKYTKDEQHGMYGKYFDNNKDDLTPDNAIQVFEMEHVFNSKVLQPMLEYLFHKLESMMFTGKLTYLILDECWLMLDNERFASKIREWVKVLRKKKVAVIFATQSLSDVINSKIKDALIESCPTKIFLPNENAKTKDKEAYITFGLNNRVIDQITFGTPKRDYMLCGEGDKLFQLNVTSLELAYVGASSIDDQNMWKILKEKADSLDELNDMWVEYKGVK